MLNFYGLLDNNKKGVTKWREYQKNVGLGTTLKITLIYQWKQVSKISHHVNYIFIFFMNLFGHWKNGILWSPYHVKKMYFMLDLWILCTKHWCQRLFEIQGLLLCLIIPRLEKKTNEMLPKWALGGFFFTTFWSTIPCTHLGKKNSPHYISRGISKEDGLIDICVPQC